MNRVRRRSIPLYGGQGQAHYHRGFATKALGRSRLCSGGLLVHTGMTADAKSISRSGDRHSHINIGLRLRYQDQWERVDALGWNEVGFNFFHTREITGPVLEFKRQLNAFEGRIVWSAPNTSDEVLMAALLNERIYQQAKKLATNAALHNRLLKLMRVSDMLAQKQAVLASLGHIISDAEMADLVAQRRQERPLYHYGVQVDSESWRATVQKAFSLSSAVASLEQWADSLARK